MLHQATNHYILFNHVALQALEGCQISEWSIDSTTQPTRWQAPAASQI